MRLTAAEYAELIKRRPALAGLGGPKPEPDNRRESAHRGVEESAARVGYRVTIISCRRRLLDQHDNLRTAHKALVDAITRSLGFSADNDAGLIWEYGQLVSERPGTIVKIERTT